MVHAALYAGQGKLISLQLRLLVIRHATEKATEAKFDVGKFHDFILSQGLLPPALLLKAVMEDFVGKN